MDALALSEAHPRRMSPEANCQIEAPGKYTQRIVLLQFCLYLVGVHPARQLQKAMQSRDDIGQFALFSNRFELFGEDVISGCLELPFEKSFIGIGVHPGAAPACTEGAEILRVSVDYLSSSFLGGAAVVIRVDQHPCGLVLLTLFSQGHDLDHAGSPLVDTVWIDSAEELGEVHFDVEQGSVVLIGLIPDRAGSQNEDHHQAEYDKQHRDEDEGKLIGHDVVHKRAEEDEQK